MLTPDDIEPCGNTGTHAHHTYGTKFCPGVEALSPGEVSPAEVEHWLLENGYAEEHVGYGHVTGSDLAAALHKEFLIYRAYR